LAIARPTVRNKDLGGLEFMACEYISIT